MHLPANAVGVLYRADSGAPPEHFIISDARTGARLPLRVTEIAALKGLAKLPLTSPLRSTLFSLYRIEPRAGFQVGGRYVIGGGFNKSLHVRIEDVRVDPKRLGLAVLRDGHGNRVPVRREATCGSWVDPGLIQPIAFGVPDRLRRFQERILMLPVNVGGAAWTSTVGGLHGISSASDFHAGAGRFGLAPQMHNAFSKEAQQQTASGGIGGVAGFLEIEDALYFVTPVLIPVRPSSFPSIDSLDMLRLALRRGDVAALRAQVAMLPDGYADVYMASDEAGFQYSDTPPKHIQRVSIAYRLRRHALFNELTRLFRHPDSTVRKNAMGALTRSLPRLRADVRTVHRSVDAMAHSLRDPDAGVRRAAYDELVHIGASDWLSRRQCTPGSLSRWTGSCFDYSRLPQAVRAAPEVAREIKLSPLKSELLL